MKYIFRKFWYSKILKLPSYFGEKSKFAYKNQSQIFEEIDYIIRNFQNETPSVSIITPSVGSRFLEKNIESVLAQSFQDFEHIIVIDGSQYRERIKTIVSAFSDPRIRLIELPHNTGRNGLNGHRVYVAMPFLLNSQYILFLDEDNWLKNNHVYSVVQAMRDDSLDWVFSFRNIFTESGEFVCRDLCESIGEYKPYSEMNPLVDTSCYAFKRSVIIKISNFWYYHKDADRYFFYHLSKYFSKFRSTKLYSVNYRLKDDRAPYPRFFLEGNNFMLQKYDGRLPWIIKR